PATSDVRTFASAVAQDVGVGASSFFKGVGQDGKVLKAALFVECLGDDNDVRCQPGSFDVDGAEHDRAKNATEYVGLDGEGQLISVVVLGERHCPVEGYFGPPLPSIPERRDGTLLLVSPILGFKEGCPIRLVIILGNFISKAARTAEE